MSSARPAQEGSGRSAHAIGAPRWVRPQILGIVNITRDSFSDGGRYLKPEAALRHARALSRAGADILDLGPASSHPDASVVSPEEERRRLEPVLPALVAEGHVCSVDSFHTATQDWALSAGAHWLNDVQGFADAAFYERLAAHECRLVVMHNLAQTGKAQRQPMTADKIYDIVARFFDARLTALEKAGVACARVVLDPGMGFFLGAGPAPSLRMLAQWPRLKARFGRPMLLSMSRKSFLWKTTDRSIASAGPVSLAAELWAALQGVDYLRTHDVAQLHDSLRLWQAVEGEGGETDLAV